MANQSKIIPWAIGLPVAVILYLYDDVLWGPVPIALAHKWLGWPEGLAFLALLYGLASFIACYFILLDYEQHPAKTHKSHWLKAKREHRKSFAYRLLLSGRWLGLAVSCFALGAIATAIPVGKIRLFSGVSKVALAFVMSLEFVVLFLGFYGGLFTLILAEGVWGVAIAALVLFIVVKLVINFHRKFQPEH